MSEDIYNNRQDKFIVSQKPNRMKVDDADKASTDMLCNCPGSEPGKVKIDVNEHVPECLFRKRSSRYATRTLVIPRKIMDGCSLGVAIGSEDF